MGPWISSSTESASGESPRSPATEAERSAEPGRSEVDNNSIRWVLVATLAFWLVVYGAGRSFF